MMRYGNALLASSYTESTRPSNLKDICGKISAVLTDKYQVPASQFENFKDYLYNKPGSPRYTPLRKALENGKQIKVEYQDLLLSSPKLPSSVGALTKKYYEDSLLLAQKLKLVNKDQNILLPRGRLSLSSGWSSDAPYNLNEKDKLYLGLWLLDVDRDWIWSFFNQLPDNPNFEINIENRVKLLLQSWQHVLNAKEILTGKSQDANVRSRIFELIKITERNVREGLNLGQPWSWFLMPRLELLVDSGILYKKDRHKLSGYSLTSAGINFLSVCKSTDSGESLIDNYFYCRSSNKQSVEKSIQWNEIFEMLESHSSVLQNSVGYFPIFETACAICVSRYLNAANDELFWEIKNIKETLRQESKSSSPRIRLAINRQGNIYAFKPINR